ncbi:MAG: hypothetical protein PHD21_07840 [Flavobacteriales bacterium]|nr:hypothetical protein [Flavobacteriales bacterium]
MIDNDVVSILVAWGKGEDLIKRIRSFGTNRSIGREIQQYCVSVSEKDFEILKNTDRIEDIDGIWAQKDPYLYDSMVGLINNEMLNNEILIK